MYKKIDLTDLELLYQLLKKHGLIYAPLKIKENLYEFSEADSMERVSLSYPRTMIPPKKFLIKPKEIIYQTDAVKGFTEKLDEESKAVVLGVHACDINAINLLDKIYLEEFPDGYYRARRNNTVIIGVSCQPDEYCFCESTGTSYANSGFDLFLHELTDGYLIRVGSSKGFKIIDDGKNIFKEAEPKDIEEFKSRENMRIEKFQLHLNTQGLQDILDLSYDSPVWRENADLCFGCGSCNLTCPTCRCYDVVDYLNLDLNTGERTRRWDSCMLRQHALVAGGLNFRPTRIERLINRFNCKGSLSGGALNCVGCGRCTVYCPAGIDFVKIIQKVRGEL